ncbi:MAG: hypothetical protein HZA79_00385 [Sphingobacteriales bacterium]|nr:hypothetical protein [Sphingobacteriales bacterium]
MKKKLIRYVLIPVVSLIVLLFAFSASPEISKEDKTYIRAFLDEWKFTDSSGSIHQSFETEMEFISRLQDSVIRSVRHSFNAYSDLGDIKYYFETRKGLCYDRAAMMEKFLMYFGFKIRHIYLYFNLENKPLGVTDFFRSNLSSHAMLEVKTQKGWMVMGTNSNWLGWQSDGQPLTIFAVRRKLREGGIQLKKTGALGMGKPFFVDLPDPGKFKIVYGIYSRHGQFMVSRPVESSLRAVGLRSPFPDYNLRMLLSNF